MAHTTLGAMSGKDWDHVDAGRVSVRRPRLVEA